MSPKYVASDDSNANIFQGKICNFSPSHFFHFVLHFIEHLNNYTCTCVFVAWIRSPDSSKVRMKMVYASSKDRFKRELDGISFELQATDPSEMSLDIVKGRAC